MKSTTQSYETMIQMASQLSITDQLKLLEWLINQLKQTVMAVLPQPKTAIYLTGQDLAQSDIVGLWADRQITDSVTYSQELRRQAETRF